MKLTPIILASAFALSTIALANAAPRPEVRTITVQPAWASFIRTTAIRTAIRMVPQH